MNCFNSGAVAAVTTDVSMEVLLEIDDIRVQICTGSGEGSTDGGCDVITCCTLSLAFPGKGHAFTTGSHDTLDDVGRTSCGIELSRLLRRLVSDVISFMRSLVVVGRSPNISLRTIVVKLVSLWISSKIFSGIVSLLVMREKELSLGEGSVGDWQSSLSFNKS